MKNNLLSLSLCCLSLSAASYAETSEQAQYEASAELGMLYTTGNTKSADIKAGFDISYQTGDWKNIGQFDLLFKKTEITDENGNENFDTSEQKWSIVGQSNYTIDTEDASYLYGNASYEDNRFSSFDNQSSVSFGWGRRWYQTENSSLYVDFGPGYKRDVIRKTDETISSFIVQAQASYTHQFNENVQFKQSLVARIATKSEASSIYKSETSVSTKLIETLQLKFSLIIDYNTKVFEDDEKTNTETALTLVYSF